MNYYKTDAWKILNNNLNWKESICLHKKELVLINGVGIVDSDYYGNPDNDGEICFAFSSLNETGSFIKKGEKIGQGIIQKFIKAENDNSSNSTAVRAGGFGSTGE